MKKSFRISILIIFLLIFSLIVWFFIYRNKGTPVYKVGAILPLTGNLAEVGQMERDALLLAQEDVNQSGSGGGNKIVLLIEDSKGDAKEGVSAAMKLIDIDKVKFIITTLTGVSSAVQPIIDKNKVIQYAYTFDPTLPGKSEYTFRIYPSYNQSSEVMIDYIKARGLKKISAIHTNVPGETYAIENLIAPKLKDAGIEFRKESFNFGDKDVKPQLLKLKSFKPDLFIIHTYSFQVPMILKGIAEIAFRPQLMGNMAFCELSEVPQQQLENVLVTAPRFVLDPSKSENFIKRFKEKYGKEPNFDAAYVYDSFRLLASAIQKVGYDPETCKKFLLSAKKYDGITGEIEILPNGDSRVAMKLGVFKEGKIRPYIQ